MYDRNLEIAQAFCREHFKKNQLNRQLNCEH